MRTFVIVPQDIDAVFSRDTFQHYVLDVNPYGRIEENALAIDLQWFAAEDEGRTFDPTERKIQKEREKGRVAKSADIPSSLILIAVVGMIWGIGRYYVNNFRSIFGFYFSRVQSIDDAGFAAEGTHFVLYMMRFIWPVVVVVVVLGILGNVMQFGWAPSIKPITPDMSRVSLNFTKWFEKIFSVQGMYSTGTSLLKIGIITMVIVFNIIFYMDDIATTLFQSFETGIGIGIKIVFSVLLETGIVLLGLGLIDYQFQRFQFMNQLKMSFQDIKEEFKESEGDPEVKRRIQGKMQDYLQRNIVNDVSDSDVLVTNPTHFAVAMKYERETMDAPQVMAKGEDAMALRMRRIAKESDVPIIENKPLARALYADLEVGDEIPEKYYGAIVLIFQEVYKMKGEEAWQD